MSTRCVCEKGAFFFFYFNTGWFVSLLCLFLRAPKRDKPTRVKICLSRASFCACRRETETNQHIYIYIYRVKACLLRASFCACRRETETNQQDRDKPTRKRWTNHIQTTQLVSFARLFLRVPARTLGCLVLVGLKCGVRLGWVLVFVGLRCGVRGLEVFSWQRFMRVIWIIYSYRLEHKMRVRGFEVFSRQRVRGFEVFKMSDMTHLLIQAWA